MTQHGGKAYPSWDQTAIGTKGHPFSEILQICGQKHHFQTKISFPVFLPASPQAYLLHHKLLTSASNKTFDELLESRAWHGAAGNSPSVDGYRMAEINALRQAQEECFPSELEQLKTGKSLSRSSRLKTLTPKLDNETQLIRVGDRLRCSPYLDPDAIHPIALDPKHPVSKLLIWH